MGPAKRFAVLGLYNSGSTLVAGILHRLGVNLGAPFSCNSRDDSDENFYESYELAWHLREWWTEPYGIERVTGTTRVCYLRHWALMQLCLRPAPVGAKHPLLSLCGPDLIRAWGDETRFIWAWRPLTESIERLQVRNWFGNQSSPLQHRLWDELHRFEASRPRMMKIEFARFRADRQGAVRALADYLGLTPTNPQCQSAVSFIRA